MDTISSGWAIRRNGSCLAGLELDCGPTLAPFRGCCPMGYVCPSQYNIACCPEGNNCTSSFVQAPQARCANLTWDLYDNGGYFCCQSGEKGFSRLSNSNGCSKPGTVYRTGDQDLPILVAGIKTTSSSPSSSSSTSAAATVYVESNASNGSSTPIGAIVGGVVGGVIALALLGALALFLLRRRKQKQAADTDPPFVQPRYEVDASITKYRMDESQTICEADSGRDTQPGELAAVSVGAPARPAELPAGDLSTK